MNRAALNRLERATAHLTCSVCQRSFAPVSNLRVRKYQYQFTPDAVRELAALLLPARVACPGCNRNCIDIALIPDEGKHRALALLRTARGTET